MPKAKFRMTATVTRSWRAPDKTEYPLIEGFHKFTITVYRKDSDIAVAWDPCNCVIALGARRIRGVKEAWIGAGGDAYIVFTRSELFPNGYAVHYVIPVGTKQVRDYFDKHKKAEHLDIYLRAPTAARTIDARSKANKRRYAERKAGTGRPYKPRGSPQNKGMHLPAAEVLVASHSRSFPHTPLSLKDDLDEARTRQQSSPSHHRPRANYTSNLVAATPLQ